MTSALWIAKTGLDAQQTRMSVISNNLANVNTTGFKRGRAQFEDLLYQNVRQTGGQSSQNTQLPSGLMLGTGVRTVSTCLLYTSYNYSTSSTFYDSQGTSHTLTTYFVKDSGTPNSWTVYYGADGKNPLGDPAATPPVAAAVTPTNNTITFDTNGQIVKTLDHDSDPTTPNVFDPLPITVNLAALNPNSGATTPLAMSLDFTGSTQFGSCLLYTSIA